MVVQILKNMKKHTQGSGEKGKSGMKGEKSGLNGEVLEGVRTPMPQCNRELNVSVSYCLRSCVGKGALMCTHVRVCFFALFFPPSEIQFTLSHIHETPGEVICQSGETVRVCAAWLAMCVSVRPLFVCSDSSSCSGHPQSQCY